MQQNKAEYVQSVTFEKDDPEIQTLTTNLEAQGVRVVFASSPVMKDGEDTVSMRSYKWTSDDPKDATNVMFPTRINPETFQTENKMSGVLRREITKLEQKLIDQGTKTFYFYHLGFQTAIDIDGTIRLCLLFRGEMA